MIDESPLALTLEPGASRATRPSRRRTHVLAFLRAHPWAMAPDAFETMLAVLDGDGLAGETLRGAFRDADDDDDDAPEGYRRAGRVALVPILGVIAHRVNLVSRVSGGTSTEGIGAAVSRAAADPEVGAIVLDINSPGGGVYGVHEAHAAILGARARGRRVVAAIDGLGASAAYWLASAADEIVITESSEAGSIGVFGVHEDWSKAFAADGITTTIFRAGPYKNEDSRYEPLSEDARAALQARVDRYYALFLADVADGRRVTAAHVGAAYGQGRVLTAPDALAAGLVDRYASASDVVAELNAPPVAPSLSPADASRRAALAQAVHALTTFDLRR